MTAALHACFQALPVGDAALPTKRTHWTVIRGPHVHKTSREQFARTTHQRVVSYATNNLSGETLNLNCEQLSLVKAGHNRCKYLQL